jgi:putative flippase GtrA
MPIFAKLAKFGVVGAFVTAFNYLLYVGLISMGFHYLVPTTLGWGIGLLVGFIGNKYWTFSRRTLTTPGEISRFLLAYLLQLAFGTTTLVLMIDHLGIDPRPAFFINVGLTAAFSFMFLDRFVFPTSEDVRRARV